MPSPSQYGPIEMEPELAGKGVGGLLGEGSACRSLRELSQGSTSLIQDFCSSRAARCRSKP